jgi:adenine-specific DNA-methyltransferase
MDKLKMHSPDLTQGNIDKIAELFPGVVTEGLDEDGGPTKVVDFDLLRQELSPHIVEGPQERYQLDWPGKREALFAANAPIAKTLRPVREESVDFDTTKNLFIEGDNLDALKLLQESYLGKVKLIYIDPPYNTGKDFVYSDDFSESVGQYLERSRQADESGARLVANAESNGRFHSDWLSMIYSRLRLARRLLADDGVIFISIDDGEVSNLRRMCDEVFGERQFVAQIVWKKRNTPPNDRVMGAQHEYMLVYVRRDLSGLRLRPRSEEQIARYKNPDDHPKGPWVAGDLTANVKGGRYVASLSYPIRNPRTGAEHWPPSGGNWRFNADRIAELIEADEIYFGKDDKGAPKLKRFLADVKEGTTWTTLWDFAPLNAEGSKEMAEIFGSGNAFESPKPVGLLTYVLQAATDSESVVVDFFAGSSSMAAAVMSLNASDGGRRRYIMVQLSESIEAGSAGAELGFSSISQLGAERVRRVGAGLRGHGVDVGFRLLRVDTTNLAEVTRTPDAVTQNGLAFEIDSVKPDRSAEDLLFQVLIDWGLELTMEVSTESIDNREVFIIEDGVLIACFENEVTPAVVREIASRQPLRAVFRDSGFVTDADRINAEQVFAELSPSTDVKAI